MMRLLTPFMPYIAGAALAAAILAGGALWWQSGTIDRLRADKASLERSVAALERQAAQAALSREVAAARAKAAQAMTAEKDAALDAIRNLDLGECADETIDPALRDLLDRRGLRSDD
jgi:hypothetical protein